MRIPLLALSTETTLMIADYHNNAKHPVDHIDWLRVALVLNTVAEYNNGQLTEDEMHDGFNSAFNGDAARVLDRTRDLIRPMNDEVPPFTMPK